MTPTTPTLTARAAYRDLVAARKRCGLCPALTNPAAVAGGALDSDEIGPYTRWHGDLNARLVVVGKDFAPVARFEDYDGRPGGDVETNRRLSRYLELAGFPPGPVSRSQSDAGLFFTNAVLCLPGGDAMRTTVSATEVRTCATRFLAATLEIVAPQVVAALGEKATAAVLHACGVTTTRAFAELVGDPGGFALPQGPVLFAMPHPVASRPKVEHEVAWRRIRVWLEGAGG